MYIEDDDDLIAALETNAAPNRAPVLDRIWDGKATYDQTFDLINRYQAHSPHTAIGFKAGQWFETTEDIYWYFLECLPPLYQTASGFVMVECTMDDLYEAFFVMNGRYFCAVVRWPGRETFHTITLALATEITS